MQGYPPPPMQGASGYGPPPQQGFSSYQPSYGQSQPPPMQQAPIQPPSFNHGPNLQMGQPAHPSAVGGFTGQAPVQQAFSGQHTNQSPQTYLGAPLLSTENPFNTYATNTPLSLPTYNPSQDVEALHKAMKGFGTDEKTLIRILSGRTSEQMPVLEAAYQARFGKSLEDAVKKEVSGHLEDVLVALIQGPLLYDCEMLRKACRGLGTNETMLTELLVGRSPNDLQMLRAAYQKAYNASLDQVVAGELSLKTKDAFNIILQGRWQDNGFVDPSMVQNDVHQLSSNMRLGQTDEILICSIVFARSPVYLQALCQAYRQTTREPLTKAVRHHFTGHMQDALIHALNGGKKDGTGVWRDAKLLMKAMEGAGTKDQLLIMRIVRGHWNQPRWRAVCQAFQTKYRTPLATRVKRETSRKYEDALVAIIG